MAITKASSSAVAPAAKGDLVVGNATNDSGVLAVGSTDQVLTVDSSTATGLKWATASSGGMTLLSTTNLGSTSTVVSGINGTYTDLMIVVQDAKVATSTGRIRVSVGTLKGVKIDLQQSSSGTTAVIETPLDIPTTANQNSFTVKIGQYADGTYAKSFIAYGSMNPTSNDATLIAGNISTTTAISSITITSSSGTGTFNGGRILIYGVK